ncbi:Putative alpha-mannosyltransferase, nucleotide-diphospho-sugar transferase [Septoria linicola]|uniref:Alpha-mannosyltransferase, nucleotide-diphospho-sugar transferase n=1 Tax=Septoria linicola TaxID=215465 RepID=A0A9Q9AUT7_9PEZI|nr:Putative alpha-mannosyltransferase, nucleotide-diphospho-sugar transferase [Septoria linicola]
MCRVIGSIFLLCLLAVFFFPAAVTSGPVATGESAPIHKARDATEDPRYVPEERHAGVPVAVIPEEEELVLAKPVAVRQEPPQQKPIKPKAADRSIEQAVSQLRSLFPDEVRMKGLLSPLTATGEALLRDLAFRVRAYKDALAAWEALHFVVGDYGLQQREIIPLLRAANLPSETFAHTVHSYDRFRAYINKLAARLFPWTMAFYADHTALHASFYSGGRGLVLTAGDQQAPYLLVTIPSFRKLGCDLPIEVLYLGDEDLSEDYRDSLEAIPGVLTRDLSQMVNDEGWALKGWAMKPFAILMSSFREVLFIDADALFLVNPETLFEDEQYTSTGALFFKDRNLSPEKKRGWLKSILPNPISEHVKRSRLWTGESGHMQDSGVLLIDKWKHYVPLLLTTRMNGPDRDGNKDLGKKGVYEMVYGDKETFWLSWELAADTGYAFHDSVAGSMGVLNNTAAKKASEAICSPQLLHFDREGRPLWFNGYLATSKDNDSDLKSYQSFDVFMREPREKGRATNSDVWTIMPSNVVCLEAEEHFPFTAHESTVLEMLLDLARNSLDFDDAS